jgi:hypothetical protein
VLKNPLGAAGGWTGKDGWGEMNGCESVPAAWAPDEELGNAPGGDMSKYTPCCPGAGMAFCSAQPDISYSFSQGSD